MVRAVPPHAVHELLHIVRFFGLFEREHLCCDGSVTVQQCLLLQCLLEGSKTISELSTAVGVSVSTMSRVVDGLERKSYINRKHGVMDRRHVCIGLSEEGQKEATRLKGMTDEYIQKVFDFVPAEHRATVIQSLQMLSRAMQLANEQGISCCGSC